MLETTTATKPEVLKKNDFDKLFRDHRAMVLRAAHSVVKCRQDAEDVLQTVFAQLLDGKCRTQLVFSPKAYLHRMAVNCALNLLRSREHQKVDSDADVEYLESPQSRSGAYNYDGFSPEFQKILSQFKPIVAEMLILRYVEDYSDDRIAMMLGRPRIWVAVTLSRVRKKLEKAMRASGETR
jgi:RNA polymerase sigma factor (sigma-70 family)